MQEKNVRITKRQIGNTLYLIESTTSASARETVCEKVKRLILCNTQEPQMKIAS